MFSNKKWPRFESINKGKNNLSVRSADPCQTIFLGCQSNTDFISATWYNLFVISI